MDRITKERVRSVVRVVAAGAMIVVGVLHFTQPDGFVKIVPSWLPAPLALVLISGFFEIAGGVGLLIPRVRRAAGIGLVALYVCVFPANVNMVVHPEITPTIPIAVLWLRLPFQILFVWLASWISKPDQPQAAQSEFSARVKP
ncbi:MAG TPA: DoxX family protein [Polyangiaceae bacterium]